MKTPPSQTGRGVALRSSDVDTDQIIPSEYCRRLTRSGYADALFARWRADPGFVLNQPAHAGASVLLAGANFGTGSSREHAVWALRDWGFIAVIATGFGDIFRRNALRNGLLAIELPESFVSDLSDDVDADPTTAITIRLDATSVSTSERTHSFELDSRVRWLLLNGFDEIDATLRSTQDIDRHEQSRPAWLPRVRLTSMAGDAP